MSDVTITVNDRQIVAAENELLLRVLNRNGIDSP